MSTKRVLLLAATASLGLVLCLSLSGSIAGYDPDSEDTDGDGLTDLEEVEEYETDPEEDDTDGDDLEDGEEVDEYETDPLEEDTDGDGYDDGEEIDEGTDPLDPENHPAD